MPADFDHRRAAVALAAAFVIAMAVFALWPGLDLWLSGLFYVEGRGFPLGGNPWVELVRNAIWNASILVFAGALVVLLWRAARRDLRGPAGRLAGYIFLLYLLGPVLLVNVVLKEHWGRARPADVTAFGGGAAFTPPWLPADQCQHNCSFVSGEGAAATALALSFLVLAPAARRRLPRAGFAAYAAAGVFLPLAGLALRVMTGRHFLSDTVFAVIFVSAIGLVLHRAILGAKGPAGLC